MFHPKHYLKRWHIDFNEDADKLAKDENFDSWSKAFTYHRQYEPFPNDEDLPVISGWRMTEMGTTQAVYERNPYYWKVDTQGNQLPYIDEVVANLVSNVEAINLNTISGNFDYACLELSLKNYPVYKENEQQGGYQVLNWSSTDGSVATYSFNLNHQDEVLRELFRDVRWRQAMSLAIDRDAINETIYFGLAVPRQTTVLPECSFFKESWARSFAEYDPERANELLDELGLTERDSEGFRLRPDGEPLSIVVNVHDINVYLPITEMVAEYWNAVGVKTSLNEVTWELFFTKREALDFDCDVWHLGLAMEGSLYSNPERFSPMLGENSVAPAWGLWFNTDGQEGEEPPEEIKRLRRWLDEWQMLPQDDPEYIPTARKIYDYYAENIWTIGTVGMPRVPAVVSTDLENVPLEGYHGNDNGFARTFQPWQWFFTE
jgi:peptide/nickel transport system substrate-binding protein